ncbi:hypothetical protein [Gordonia liuliyuniae]|uniref:Uncharacterized protein n=2 Tax=Gordonia liuliyuniae TaxID=2911517 RepID=A0ABS9IPA0_9ACTN|nr:hypothetical protein [Gordonia liuliyuniae]MCF8587365.1 hypothetical protein [Gordonia liuliyuniae]
MRTPKIVLAVIAAAGLVVAVPTQAHAAPKCPTTVTASTSKAATVSALRNSCSQAGIDRLFRTADAGAIPKGVYHGQTRPIGGPNDAASDAASAIWSGKHFYNGWLNNRVLGGEALSANVYYGPSTVDGKRVVRIDYARSGLGFAHDELRRLPNGVYVGYGFLGADKGVSFWVWK